MPFVSLARRNTKWTNDSGEASAFAFVSGLYPFLILYNQNNLDTTAIGRTFVHEVFPSIANITGEAVF
ncbi:hypothetical protein PCCS19_01650 [Paenibacillus sp. CCS19]|nr:hypothetical protein PCCS19_01650 [Paenibacillus cellulosilyticus]